jgi:hypothetical protein
MSLVFLSLLACAGGVLHKRENRAAQDRLTPEEVFAICRDRHIEYFGIERLAVAG